MKPIVYINRKTGKQETEQVYGDAALRLAYGKSMIGKILRTLSAKTSLFSRLYGFWQKMPWTKGKVIPFIQKYHVNSNEFLKSPNSFTSFNAFFIRQLKPESRPISLQDLVIPADGRYYFYQNIEEADGFIVKGKKFSLEKLLGSKECAKRYAEGSLLMARLCPTDYHRFHFPCDCTPKKARLVNGYLYSVNPIAIKQNIDIFSENKRYITELVSDSAGTVQYIEVGATNVGSVVQTYTPEKMYEKGAEKGYFSFGGSALILLFEKGRINFESDLLAATESGCEILCQMGQPLAAANLR